MEKCGLQGGNWEEKLRWRLGVERQHSHTTTAYTQLYILIKKSY